MTKPETENCGEPKIETVKENVPMCDQKAEHGVSFTWQEYDRLIRERDALIAARVALPEDLEMPLRPRSAVRVKDWKDERFPLPDYAANTREYRRLVDERTHLLSIGVEEATLRPLPHAPRAPAGFPIPEDGRLTIPGVTTKEEAERLAMEILEQAANPLLTVPEGVKRVRVMASATIPVTDAEQEITFQVGEAPRGPLMHVPDGTGTALPELHGEDDASWAEHVGEVTREKIDGMSREEIEAVGKPFTEYVWDGAKGSKDSNPKEAFGSRKAGLSTVSTQVKYEIGLAMLEGALKYGRHNYRIAGVRGSTYYDACGRHMDAWWEGEDIDPHSGAKLHHITKAIAGLTVLRDSILAGNWTDDRPPRIEPRDWMEQYNEEAKKMVDATETPKAPYTEKEHGK